MFGMHQNRLRPELRPRTPGELTTLSGLPGQFGDALLHSPLLDAYGVSIGFTWHIGGRVLIILYTPFGYAPAEG